MKAYRILALIFASALFFSCDQKEPVEPVEPVGPQSETRTLTFTLPSSQAASAALKTAWQAGDQIVVHGEYAKDQVVVTLEASDISSDGKTATKTVEIFPYKRQDCVSDLYAAYPASVVSNLKHCFFYSQFNNTNEQLLAACNEGNNFNFTNVCGAMTVKVGDFDSYLVTGAKKDALGYEFLQVKLTDQEQNLNQYVGTSVLQYEGAVNNGTVTLFIPDGFELTGCILKFKKNGKFVGMLKIEEPITIAHGQVVDFGDLTAEIAPYEDPFSEDILDIDKNGNANCYIVTEPGKYKFKAVRGNSAIDYLSDVAGAEILWETYNDDSEVAASSIVNTVSYAEDYVLFHAPDPLVPGNAVICAKDYDGKILWSWHIWVPATKIEENTYGIFNTAVMDRNLGALVAAVAGDEPVDIRSYGLIYQWGRKDPFVNADGVKSSDNATVAGVELSKAPSLISIEESIANPTLMGHIDGGDWSTTHEQDLWQDDDKTIYDPCPAGYKVPGRDKSQIIFGGKYDSSIEGWAYSADAYWITIGSPKTVFPVAGYRDDYSVDEMAKTGKRAAIWTAHCSADGIAYHLNWRVDSKSFSLGETARARGCSVRCVAEK